MDGRSDGIAVAPADRPPAIASELPLSVSLSFGVGTIGTAVLLNTVTVYLPAFFATVLGRSAGLAGLLLTISKLYDIFCDIAIGLASDRTRTRLGRRRPYMLAGAIVGTLAFCKIFSPPDVSPDMMVWQMALLLLLYSTGYSLFNVPYLALPPEIAPSYHSRTRLMSYRTFFVAVGQVIALSASGWILQRLGGNRHGYAVMGYLLAAVVLVTELGTVAGLRETACVQEATSARDMLASLRAVLHNRPFGILMAAKFAQLLGVASAISMILLFMLNVLKVGYAGQAYFSLMQNVAIAVSMPGWVRAARLFGKRGCAVAAVIVYGASSLSWLLAGTGEAMALILVRAAFMGISAGGILLMGASMLPDTMDFDLRTTGMRREGAYSSAYAVVEKTGFAIGPGLVGLYLARSGYVPTVFGHLVQQPASARAAMYVGTAVLPAVFMAVSLVFLCLYRLDEQTLAGLKRTCDPVVR
jgi:GPH family glycoside/pentoside/hexuronide:cation symporter